MNAKSVADQLSLLSTIIHHAKDCPKIPQPSEEWESYSEMVMQAAAVLEKIPHVQDPEVRVTHSALADCR
ncbi:MAG: hypothetical protein ACFB15_06375 [Cyclobacteriaceae bacterium]